MLHWLQMQLNLTGDILALLPGCLARCGAIPKLSIASLPGSVVMCSTTSGVQLQMAQLAMHMPTSVAVDASTF